MAASAGAPRRDSETLGPAYDKDLMQRRRRSALLMGMELDRTAASMNREMRALRGKSIGAVGGIAMG